MPSMFVLVMSFALKNTLTSAQLSFPTAGWVVEDFGPIAAQWANEWIARNGGERFTSRDQLRDALRSNGRPLETKTSILNIVSR